MNNNILTDIYNEEMSKEKKVLKHRETYYAYQQIFIVL